MSKSKILVVEDERIVALDIKNSLQELGYEVTGIASSGEDAIQKTIETNPDLVLMDIFLKGDLDGVEAAEEIRRSFNIPVVYLTAYSDENTLQRAKITEPFGYIIKPFKEREIHVVIETALHKHKMENKLKENERWLSTTLLSIGDAVISTDAEGCVKFMNPVAESLTGWTHDFALGKHIKEVFTIINEETGKAVEDIINIARDGVLIGMGNHTVLIAKDGTKKPIDNSCAPIKDDRGNLLGFVLAFNDVTKRKWLQDIIHNAREDYQTIFDSVPAMILYVNREQKVIRANNVIANILGLPVKELIGKSLTELFSPESTEFYEGNLEIINEGKPKFGLITKYRPGGDGIKWAQINKIPYFDKNGDIIGVILIAEDITERKLAEEKLKSSEQNFRAIAENAAEGILIAGKNGEHVFANRRASEITGYSVEELIGFTLKNLADPKEKGNRIDKYKKSSRKKAWPISYETSVKRKDEKVIPVDLTTAGTIWHQQEAILIFMEDISERKKTEEALLTSFKELELKVKKRTAGLSTAIEVINKEIRARNRVEKALRESEEKFRAQYKNIPVPTYTWENVGDDFILVDYNDAAVEITEGKIDTVLGRKASELYAEDPEIFSDMLKCYNEKTTVKREIVYKFRTTGKTKNLAVKYAYVLPSFVLVHTEDITERKRAESALMESEERYRMLVENQREGIGILDTNGVFIFCNPAAEEILGVPAGTLLGGSIGNFTTPETMNFLKKQTKLHQAGERGSYEIEIVRASDGEKRLLNVTSSPWVDNQGKFVGSFGVFRDETERKMAMEEKQRYFLARLEAENKLNEAIQLADRSASLASIGVLAAGITHEINQPLNAIMMNVESALYWEEQNKGILPQFFIDTLNDISAGAKSIDSIIQHMRSFWVSPVSKRKEIIDFNQTVKNAITLTNRQIQRHGIKLKMDICEDTIKTKGVRVQLELIVINLLSNSIYSLDKVDTSEKSIKISTYTDNSRAILEVYDNGIGLPEDVGDKLFDPFFSTKKPGEGMGLGLAIVKMFMDRFEGKIVARNNEEGGATFLLSFPTTAKSNGEKR